MIIYKILNKITGKIYVGQTRRTLNQRWQQHTYQIDDSTKPLYRSMKKHGLDNFEIVELCSALTLNELDNLEIHYIKLFNSMAPNGYNLTSGGENGKENSEETLKKLSLSHMGQKPWNKGRKETRPEVIEKLALAKLGKSPANKGIKRGPLSDSQKAKISKALKGKPQSVENANRSRANVAKYRESIKKKVIDQYGTVYESVNDAARKIGVRPAAVHRALYAKAIKKVNGFVLSFLIIPEIAA